MLPAFFLSVSNEVYKVFFAREQDFYNENIIVLTDTSFFMF